MMESECNHSVLKFPAPAVNPRAIQLSLTVHFTDMSFLMSSNTGRALATVNIEFKNVNPPQLTATSTLAQFTEEGPPVPFAPDITPSDNDTRCNTSLLLRASFKTANYDGVSNEILAVDEVNLNSRI